MENKKFQVDKMIIFKEYFDPWSKTLSQLTRMIEISKYNSRYLNQIKFWCSIVPIHLTANTN